MSPLARTLVVALLALAVGSAAPSLADARAAAPKPTTTTEPRQSLDSKRLPDGIEGENGATIVGGPFDYEWEDGTPLELSGGWLLLLGTFALASVGGPEATLVLFPLFGSHPEIQVIR